MHPIEGSQSESRVVVPDFLKPHMSHNVTTQAYELNPLVIIQADEMGSHFKQKFIFDNARAVARLAQSQLEAACREHIEAEVERRVQERLLELNAIPAAPVNQDPRVSLPWAFLFGRQNKSQELQAGSRHDLKAAPKKEAGIKQ